MLKVAYREKEAAQVLSIGLSQMREIIARGEIKVVQAGPRTILIPHSELERWLAENLAAKAS